MRTLATVIAIILLASLILNGYLLWDRAKSEKDKILVNREWQEKIEDHKATIEKAGDRLREVQGRRIRDSLFYKSRLMASNAEIKAYKSQVAKLRPQVQAKIDSFPDLRQFVEIQDSIIVKQDSLIRAQDLFCALQIKDFNEILALHHQKFQAQAQISEAWMETAAEARKDVVKEKRRKGFFKVTSAILAGGILFMAVRE